MCEKEKKGILGKAYNQGCSGSLRAALQVISSAQEGVGQEPPIVAAPRVRLPSVAQGTIVLSFLLKQGKGGVE